MMTVFNEKLNSIVNYCVYNILTNEDHYFDIWSNRDVENNLLGLFVYERRNCISKKLRYDLRSLNHHFLIMVMDDKNIITKNKYIDPKQFGVK